VARAADSTIKEALEPDGLPSQQRARRDRIIQAALDLLKEGEYEEIQIKDVADRAGVALATLYRYFTSKEHLYAAVLLEWSRTAETRQRAGVEQLDTDAERIRFLLIGVVKAVGRRPQVLRAEMVLATTRDPNARVLFDRFAERHNEVMTAALRDVSADKAAAIVEVTSSVLGTQLQSWARGRCTIKDVERSINRTVDLVLPDEG
jgi:AcrR family transcriptional regulator